MAENQNEQNRVNLVEMSKNGYKWVNKHIERYRAKNSGIKTNKSEQTTVNSVKND